VRLGHLELERDAVSERLPADPTGTYGLSDPDNDDAYRIEFEHTSRAISTGVAPVFGRYSHHRHPRPAHHENRPMSTPLRVGVGCGIVALNFHVPAYQALPDRYEIVGLADPTPERLQLGREKADLAAAMVDAADLAGVVLAVIHNYLFFPEIVALRALVDCGLGPSAVGSGSRADSPSSTEPAAWPGRRN
jgi:hypothetical protein